MDDYLEIYRPLITGAQSHVGLWASMKGGTMTGEALYDRVIKHTKEAFGKPINLHLFRSIVATTIAIDNPKYVRHAASMLGHSDFRTTEQYYIQANALEAARNYHEGIAALKNRLQNTTATSAKGD